MMTKDRQMALLIVLVAILIGGLLAVIRTQTPDGVTISTAFVGFIGTVITGILFMISRNGNGSSNGPSGTKP